MSIEHGHFFCGNLATLLLDHARTGKRVRLPAGLEKKPCGVFLRADGTVRNKGFAKASAGFSADNAKILGDTLCIPEDFCEVWQENGWRVL